MRNQSIYLGIVNSYSKTMLFGMLIAVCTGVICLCIGAGSVIQPTAVVPVGTSLNGSSGSKVDRSEKQPGRQVRLSVHCGLVSKEASHLESLWHSVDA